MEITQIEEQLTDKAVEEINECSRIMVDVLKNFAKNKAGLNTNGIHWPTNRKYNDGWSKNDGIYREKYSYDYSHLDYSELEKFFAKVLSEEFLGDVVRHKTTNLLSKLELLD